MKKIIKIALGGIILCASVASICAITINRSDNGVSDYGYDAIYEHSKEDSIKVKQLATADGIEYSKTYAQYATDGEYYYVRCATALKGSDIYSVVYNRGEMSGSDESVANEVNVNVESLYRYLYAGGETVYYNGTDLVSEPTAETEGYYWACYTLKYNSANFHASDFNITLSINGEATENQRVVNLETLITDNASAFSSTVTRMDENYHYYACLEEGFAHLEKKEEHNIIHHSELVEPSLTDAGATPHIGCSDCDYEVASITLPALNDSDYDVSYSTGNVDGVVCDTMVYTFKDTSKGVYEFVVAGAVLSEYIHAGSSYYSLGRWNQIFTNQTATVIDTEAGKELTIALKEGTTTNITASDGVSPLDGMLNFTLYNKVTVTGNGTLNVTYSTLQDGINANSFVIDEGATVNLTGFSTEDKSGIKVYKDLVINGSFNVNNFGYAQAIVGDQSFKIRTIVGPNGKYSVNNCNFGIYAWASTKDYPLFEISGELEINTTDTCVNLLKPGDFFYLGDAVATLTSETGYGMYCQQSSVILRDNADVTINSYKSAIRHFNNLIIGNGSDNANTTQNNASLKVSSYENVIQTYSSSSNGRIVFNTTGEVLVKALNSEKTGIQFSNKSQKGLTIKTTNMTIEGAFNAIGAWVAFTSFATDYNYESPNNKLTLVNCQDIYNLTDTKGNLNNNPTYFAPLTSETVNIVTR